MHSRTAVTWWLAGLLAVVLAVISAVPLVLLVWVWFLVIPGWLIVVLVVAGSFFAASRTRPSALAWGIGVLGSVPLTILIVIAFLALATSH